MLYRLYRKDFWMKEQEYYVEIEHLIKSNEISKRARKL